MKEYTLLAAAAVVVALALDAVLRTHLVRQKRFWIFWVVMAFFKTVVNGYLTWRPIVLYGDQFNLGFRIGTIPVEDYLYGFALLTMNIVLWEYFTMKWKVTNIPANKEEEKVS